MKIGEIFKKDIHREINGVVKVEQKNEESVYQELDEYVVTKELSRHFNTFYNAYAKSLTSDTDKMGVWISGFFGSGKSHFLKILSYLLDNEAVKGQSAIRYFDGKISDPLLLGDIEKAGAISTDVILFNIDSKADANSKSKKDAIVTIFKKVFDEFQGYCGDIPWLAEIERQLTRDGVYNRFCEVFEELTGELWEARREQAYFDRDAIITSIVKVTNRSEEAVSQWFDNAEANYSLSVEKFARMVREYCTSKGKNHRLIFLIDEVGQYIGDNSDLMLNLQTVTEDLGVQCKGKVWIILTSQQDIDGLTKNKVKGNDFSKIQGRFDTRISLSSANTDEVIKRRILEKTSVAEDTLKLWYHEKSAILRNLISFSAGTAEMKSYRNETDFVEIYPFIPYQFNLLQKVFENIRKFGASGKHLSEGERSLLTSFHNAAQVIDNRPIGTLVPLQDFYSTIEKFLDSAISRTFLKTQENSRLQPFDVEVLKVLFMIKYVKEMPANLENLTTLMISEIDADKMALRQQIAQSLDRLIGETLIHKNGEEYSFLTDEEQDINRAIKNIEVEGRDILAKAGDYLFETIYPEKRFVYSKYYAYAFNRQIDGVFIGSQGNELTVKVLSPYADEFFHTPEVLKLQTTDTGMVLFRLPEDTAALEEIGEILKTEKFVSKKNSLKNPENIQKIINDKSNELDGRKKRAIGMLEQAIINAVVYASGEEISVKGSNAKEKMNKGIEALVSVVYNKLDYVQKSFPGTDDIIKVLKSNNIQIELVQSGDNRQAVSEMERFIGIQSDRNLRTTMKALVDRFTAKPYGWTRDDVAGLVATLLMTDTVSLQYQGEVLDKSDRDIINYLTKKDQAEKLMIAPRKKVDAVLINNARILGRDIFRKHDLPSEEDKLHKELLSLIAVEKSQLNEIIARFKEANYPGRETVKKGIDILTELAGLKDSFTFFDTLRDNKDELLAWEEEVTVVKSFFENQVQKYDQAREQVKYYHKNKLYIADRDVYQYVQKIETILESTEPYSLIKDIPAALNSMEQRLAQLLEHSKKEVNERLQRASETVTNAGQEAGLDSIKVEELLSGLTHLNTELNRANEFVQVNALISLIENATSKALNKVQAEIQKKKTQVAMTGGSGVGNQTGGETVTITIKPIKTVKVLAVAGIKTELDTKEDVESYVNLLKAELLAVIENNQRIKLL